MSTAKKYHISPETGRPNQCTATVRGCKFAVDGEMPEHYNSKEEARKAYENQNSDKTIASVKKAQRTRKLSNRKLSIEKMNQSEEVQKHYSISARAQLRLDDAEKELKESEAYRQSLLKAENDLDKWGVDKVVEKINYANQNWSAGEKRLNSEDYKITTPQMSEEGTVKYYSVVDDKDKLREELEKRKSSAQNKITEFANSANFWGGVVITTKGNLIGKYGYAENPRFGVPTGESTSNKWKGQHARNYSSLPTKDVEVLKDAQKYCTKCNEQLVKVTGGSFDTYAHESNKSSTCPNGAGFKQESITCKYCGTSDSKMVSFAQQPWSDETSCKRCGGVEGYAIGD